MSPSPSLYERIGDQRIRLVIAEFYRRAFTDGIIGHFFFRKDLADITAKQTAFAIAMLGGPRGYKGKPLEAIHRPLPIRAPHFGRRQQLMREVLAEQCVPEDLQEAWLDLEESLRPLILTGPGNASTAPRG